MSLRSIVTAAGLIAILCCTGTAWAQLTDQEIAALRQQGEQEGWTFVVGPSEATTYSTQQLCGMVEPKDWRKGQKLARSKEDLPVSFDWRATAGCPPVRDQGGCGSCWAFSTVGALECSIKIVDGIDVDLSEQWLLSCNQDGAGCDGGWWAHDYHQWKTDSCGGTGAVLETYFPYQASEVACGCPYPHDYFIEDWAYVDDTAMIPEPDLIKQAIMDYGPVSTCIYVNSAFHAYHGGVFNAGGSEPTNHAVVLVGWDDSLGTNGCWILRNSWGDDWGEAGYMYIEYGCSSVGFSTCYVVYTGRDDLQVTPRARYSSSGSVGGPFTPANQAYVMSNVGDTAISVSVSTDTPWISLDGPQGKASYGPISVDPASVAEVTVVINAEAESLPFGIHSGTLVFRNESAGTTTERPVRLQVGDIDYVTENFNRNDNDLDHVSVTFTPEESGDFYFACREHAAAFPTDPAEGTALTLGDDAFVEVPLEGGALITLFGEQYASVFVGSNGYVTFGTGDDNHGESFANHFDLPRVSGLFDDLDPSTGGSISWLQMPNRFVVTYEDVPEYGSGLPVSFQIELFFDGTIRLTWLDLCVTDGLVGLSAGQGLPDGFEESDFIAYPACGVEGEGEGEAPCVGQPVVGQSINAGVEDALAEVYDLIGRNPLTDDSDNNCMIDGAHIRLVDVALATPSAACNPAVVKAWNYNYAKFETFLDTIAPGYWDLIARSAVQALGAGVLTMGDQDTINIVKALISVAIGISIDVSGYDTSCNVYLATFGDADGDGVPNRNEYNYWVDRSLDTFVAAALDPRVARDGGDQCGAEGEGEGEGEGECPVREVFDTQGDAFVDVLDLAVAPELRAMLPTSWWAFDFENGNAWLDWYEGGRVGEAPESGDGILDAWQVALVGEVLCATWMPGDGVDQPGKSAWGNYMQDVRAMHDANLAAWQAAVDARLVSEMDPVVVVALEDLRDQAGDFMAALLMLSHGAQSAYLRLLEPLGIGGSFSVFTDEGKSANEPFHADGDLDDDGQTNLEEYLLTTSHGGGLDVFIQAALFNNPFWPGNPSLPAAGLAGLGLLAAGVVGVVLRRRK